MVRGDLATGVPAQVADGYHRVCASYYTDENTDIPLKLAIFPGNGCPQPHRIPPTRRQSQNASRGGPCHFFSFR